MATINSVIRVREEGGDPTAKIVTANITDFTGETYDCEYCTRPGPDNSPGSMNAMFQKWLADNHGSYTVEPFTPPTTEQIRAAMQPLTARQFRLGLVRAGLTPAQVTAAIEAMPDGAEKETALIEWGYASSFERSHPLIALVGGVLGLSDEQIDALWPEAVSL